MAVTTILRSRFRTGPTIKSEGGSSLTFDALVSESVADTGDLTEHPVEVGIDISDHFQIKAVELSVKLIHTNSPLDAALLTRNRDIELYNALRDLHSRGEVISIVTGLRSYSNMMLLSIGVSRDGSTGQQVPMDLTFKEVRFAEQETTVLPLAQLGERTKKNAKKKDKGRQQAEPVTEGDAEVDAVEKKDSSFAADLFG